MSTEPSLTDILAGSALLRSESPEQKSKWETGVRTPELILAGNDWVSDQATGDQLWRQH